MSARKVSYRYRSLAEREDIATFRAQGPGVREVVRRFGRSPSTISSGLRRNASTRKYAIGTRPRQVHFHWGTEPPRDP